MIILADRDEKMKKLNCSVESFQDINFSMVLIWINSYLCHFFQKGGATCMRFSVCVQDSYQYPAEKMVQLILKKEDSFEVSHFEF